MWIIHDERKIEMKSLENFSDQDLKEELRRRDIEKIAKIEKKKNEPELPILVDVYAYSDQRSNFEWFNGGDTDSDYNFSEKFIDDNDLEYLGSEVLLTYRIEEDHTSRLVSVDGRKLEE
jgi:hypothetical protein